MRSTLSIDKKNPRCARKPFPNTTHVFVSFIEKTHNCYVTHMITYEWSVQQCDAAGPMMFSVTIQPWCSALHQHNGTLIMFVPEGTLMLLWLTFQPFLGPLNEYEL